MTQGSGVRQNTANFPFQWERKGGKVQPEPPGSHGGCKQHPPLPYLRLLLRSLLPAGTCFSALVQIKIPHL